MLGVSSVLVLFSWLKVGIGILIVLAWLCLVFAYGVLDIVRLYRAAEKGMSLDVGKGRAR